MFGVVDDTTMTKFVNRACAVLGISLPVVVVVLKFPIDSEAMRARGIIVLVKSN